MYALFWIVFFKSSGYPVKLVILSDPVFVSLSSPILCAIRSYTAIEIRCFEVMQGAAWNEVHKL